MRSWHVLQLVISSLCFRCPFQENGCLEELKYDNFLKHQDQCDFRIQPCPNIGCKEKLFKKNVAAHIFEVCEFSLFECNFCRQKFTRTNYQTHLGECQFRFIECKECYEIIIAKDMPAHLQICPEVGKECGWCKQNIKNKFFNDHLN